MDLMQRRRVMLAGRKWPRLPAAYQEIAWIRQPSGRTAYINSNYIIKQGITKIVHSGVTFFDGNSNNIAGARKSSSGSTNFAYGSNNNSSVSSDRGFHMLCKGQTWASKKILAQLNREYEMICCLQEGLQTLEADKVQVVKLTQTGLNFNNFAGYPLYLFAINLGYRTNVPGSVDFANVSMGPVEILLNDNRERYFVPCYRKSDNKPGMYDLCGSTCPLTNSPFYINAGTGEFLVGPDVN